MGKERDWLRDFPWFLRGAVIGAGLVLFAFLVTIPQLWFVVLFLGALVGTAYTVTVHAHAVRYHKALMAATSVWVTTYRLRGEILEYDKPSGLYHVWTDANDTVSSGWFRADVLEPLTTPMSPDVYADES